MIKLYKNFGEDNKNYDVDLIELSSTVNALPGIEVCHLLIIDGLPTLMFHVDEKIQDGLFFLTRCIDNRYFKFGKNWNINMMVGDILFQNGDRPLFYELVSTSKDYKMEIRHLIENLNSHLFNENFMKMFKLNIEDFSTIDTVVEKRNGKLDSLNIN